MNTSQKEPWIERAVTLLDKSTESLDAATLSRLNRARQAALAQRHVAWRGWVIGSGFAGAALALLIALGIGHRVAPQHMLNPAAVEQGADADALATDDNLDLYENLDFYVWLDAEQPNGND
ncbi:hypothetical protein [Dokdonella soli]|uniref:DUF3619 family protein n=1 Tax=Dokdonella soli TaxID=529810 RepID=A0ABN1J0P9_9GAMM